MPGHFGWGTESFGARNCYPGEYDTVRYFTVYLGLPVYFSFRGCVHVIEPARVKPSERLERLLRFVRDYLGATNLSRPILLPLRPLRHLKRLVFYDLALWLLGCFPLVAVVATLAILQQPNPFVPVNIAFLAGCWAGTGLFGLALAVYLWTRRPSRRQAAIRGVTADRLGPFSDPAEWRDDLVAVVATDFGLPGTDAEELIEEAEQRLRQGQLEEALILARMALALADRSAAWSEANRAEDLTQECLETFQAARLDR